MKQILSLLVFNLFCCLLVAQPLKIHIINVQQGTSIIAEGPGENGKTLMFDFGKSSYASKELLPFLISEGFKEGTAFDYGVISHQDEDHYGGLELLTSKGYSFKELLDNGSTKGYPKKLEWPKKSNLITAKPGQSIKLGDGAEVLVVAVAGKMIDKYENKPSQENDKSIVLLIRYGDFEFISAGDLGGGKGDSDCTGRKTNQTNIESSVCKALYNEGLITSHGYEVLHVNHHGSESSTNAHYMNTISPLVAIVSTGEGQSKGWDHPRKDVVDNVLLAKSRCVTADPALVLQTDEVDKLEGRKSLSTSGYAVGDILITTTGKKEFKVSANGEVDGGSSELPSSKLPLTLQLD